MTFITGGALYVEPAHFSREKTLKQIKETKRKSFSNMNDFDKVIKTILMKLSKGGLIQA